MPNTEEPLGPTFQAPIMIWPKWTTILASPILFGMIVPLVIMDLCMELYHRLAFPILGIPRVIRGDYIRMDRHRLPYLSPVLKLACAYCSYANGFLQYATRIAGVTEAYFCPIKHQATPTFHAPQHQQDFLEYGDAQAWNRHLEKLATQNTRHLG